MLLFTRSLDTSLCSRITVAKPRPKLEVVDLKVNKLGANLLSFSEWRRLRASNFAFPLLLARNQKVALRRQCPVAFCPTLS